jgi:hypothetical protein
MTIVATENPPTSIASRTRGRLNSLGSNDPGFRFDPCASRSDSPHLVAGLATMRKCCRWPAPVRE